MPVKRNLVKEKTVLQQNAGVGVGGQGWSGELGVSEGKKGKVQVLPFLLVLRRVFLL